MNNDLIKEYYSQRFVLYLLANYSHKRTFELMIPRHLDPNDKGLAYRYRRVSNPSALTYFFEKYQVFEKPFNLYSSVATIDTTEFPILSMVKEEAIKQRKVINKDFKKYVTGYDLKIDIDSKNIDEAHEQARIVKKLFDDYEVPYWIMFSGRRGFNITVPYQNLWDTNVLYYPKLCKDFAERLKNKYSLKGIDLKVYDLNSFFKIPYSIARATNYVTMPLTDQQFDNFNKEDYEIDKVLKNYKLFNRRLLVRKGTKSNFLEMYEAVMGE